MTPFKACLIDCTEVSPTYCSTPVEGEPYYADLFQLIMAKILPVSKARMEEMSPALRQNMFELLNATRPMSFS